MGEACRESAQMTFSSDRQTQNSPGGCSGKQRHRFAWEGSCPFRHLFKGRKRQDHGEEENQPAGDTGRSLWIFLRLRSRFAVETETSGKQEEKEGAHPGFSGGEASCEPGNVVLHAAVTA